MRLEEYTVLDVSLVILRLLHHVPRPSSVPAPSNPLPYLDYDPRINCLAYQEFTDCSRITWILILSFTPAGLLLWPAAAAPRHVTVHARVYDGNVMPNTRPTRLNSTVASRRRRWCVLGPRLKTFQGQAPNPLPSQVGKQQPRQNGVISTVAIDYI